MENMLTHLQSRGMDTSLYQFGFDDEAREATFYLYNLSGKLVGYQRYSPDLDKKKNNDPKDCRYYTYLPAGTDGVFGLDLLNKEDRTIYIVEGLFKAATLHRLGFNAVAVLTSTPKRLKPWFRIMKATWNLVGIGDNDPAGEKLVRMVGKGFTSPKDLDEMTDQEVYELLGTVRNR